MPKASKFNNTPSSAIISHVFRTVLDQPRWVEWRELNEDKVPFIAGTNQMASHSGGEQSPPHRVQRPNRIRLGHSAMSPRCPVCRKADTAERVMVRRRSRSPRSGLPVGSSSRDPTTIPAPLARPRETRRRVRIKAFVV